MRLAEENRNQISITRLHPWNTIYKISFNKHRFSIATKTATSSGSDALVKYNYYTSSYKKYVFNNYVPEIVTVVTSFLVSFENQFQSRFQRKKESFKMLFLSFLCFFWGGGGESDVEYCF